MNIAALKYNLLLHLKNLPGPTTSKKIVVIESDDYGGIRMPSAEVYQYLKAAGIPAMNSRYNQFDTVENAADLENLFEVLCSVNDSNGHAAIVSPFVNVANPDFEKIKLSGFSEYFYEPFTSTYKKYGRENGLMDLWKEGQRKGIFMPQFHGREHLSVQLWMQQLQQGNSNLLKAFDVGFVAVGGIAGIHSFAEEFRPEFYFNSNNQQSFLQQSIKDGVQLFEKIFGYKPTSFVPSNGLFHPYFEKTVEEAGVKFLNVAHKNPSCNNNGNIQYTNYTFKQKIKKRGLSFYIRNCAFEPNDVHYKLDTTLMQVAAAFHCRKPAIISTHRVNFTGGLSMANRDKGLRELQHLLKAIIKQWPAVEFMDNQSALSHLAQCN